MGYFSDCRSLYASLLQNFLLSLEKYYNATYRLDVSTYTKWARQFDRYLRCEFEVGTSAQILTLSSHSVYAVSGFLAVQKERYVAKHGSDSFTWSSILKLLFIYHAVNFSSK